MREGQVFNRRTIAVLVVFLLGGLLYPFRDLLTRYEDLHGEVKVDDRFTLYITQVEVSSLSKDTYHYYLYDAHKSANDFMSQVKNIEPIMITNDGTATTEIKDGQIYLRVRGNVYAFRSVGYDVRIHLDRSPY